MAKEEKIKKLIRFHPEDVIFILKHTGRIGTTFQDFVTHAIKKEIKFLQENKKIMDERKANKLKS